MKKTIVSLLVCAFVSLPSWAGDTDKNVRGVKLTGKEVKNNISDWRIYTRFKMGNKLICVDQFWDNFYCAELTDKELVKEELLAKKGTGDNEFGTSSKFAKKPDNSLLVMNITSFLKEMIVIPNTKSIVDMKNSSSWKRYDMTRLKRFSHLNDSFTSFSDSTILLCGTPNDDYRHIFSIIDYKNQKVIPLIYWPEDGVDVPDAVKHSAYSKHSELLGNGKGRFLYYKIAGNRFSFVFTVDKNNKVNVIKDLYKVYPDYKAADAWNHAYASLNFEELRATANENIICMLLVDSDPEGNLYGKMSMENYSPQMYGNVVELFDWDGNKKNVLYLDHYGQRIVLSDDGKKLYLLSDNNCLQTPKEPYIWVYDISNLDNQPSVDIAEMDRIHEANKKKVQELIDKKTERYKPKTDVVKKGDMIADFELYD